MGAVKLKVSNTEGKERREFGNIDIVRMNCDYLNGKYGRVYLLPKVYARRFVCFTGGYTVAIPQQYFHFNGGYPLQAFYPGTFLSL